MTIFGVFVLVTLACASLTRAVVSDSITLPFRRWVISKVGTESKWTTLVHCPWCVGFWVSIPGAIVWAVSTLPLGWWWLALPAVMSMRYLIGLLARLEG